MPEGVKQAVKHETGGLIVGLFPEEVKEEAKGSDFFKKLLRGGTEATAPKPINELAQSITIHGLPDG